MSISMSIALVLVITGYLGVAIVIINWYLLKKGGIDKKTMEKRLRKLQKKNPEYFKKYFSDFTINT